MVHSFVPGLVAPADASRALWFAFRKDEMLVVDGEGGAADPVDDLAAIGVTPRCARYLGTIGGAPCFCADLDASTQSPEGHRFAGLRALFERMDRVALEAAGLAAQIVHWERTHQFCGACAGPLVDVATERSRRCEPCALTFYPRVSPCVIVLVHDGDRALLARQPGFPPGMFALVAGFLEPGETLEQCVAREVAEETGVAVKDLRYFGSQPWPFPHQMMVGFFAAYAGGELIVDRSELEDAQWFERDAMPRLPPRVSISRALIDAWLAETADAPARRL